MKYNIAQNGVVWADVSVSGSISLSREQINNILTGMGSGPGLVGADNELLDLRCDLGQRIDTDEIRYYFSSTSSSGTVSGTIGFYAADERETEYYSLATNIGDGYYYTTVTSGVGAARYIRVLHTVSGTAVSGTVDKFEIYNDDTVVDFGEDGSKTVESIMTSLEQPSFTRTIPVYNDGTTIATAYISLDPQYDGSDDVLSISDSTSGPWYGVNTNNVILIEDEDDWDGGSYSNTEVSSDMLVLSAGQSTGTYTTRIFSNEDLMSFPLIKLYDEENCRDLVSLSVKSSNTEPLSLHTYRKNVITAPSTWSRNNNMREYYLSDDSLYYDAASFASHHPWSTGLAQVRFFIDYPTNNTWIYGDMDNTYNGYYYVIIYKYNRESSSWSSITLSHSRTNLASTFYNLYPDGLGGCWVNFYTPLDYTGYPCIGPGYFLVYIDYLHQSQGVLKSGTRIYMDCAVEYSTGNLWYIDISLNQLTKISNSGTVLASFAEPQYTNNMKQVVVDSNGYVWLVNGTTLVKISSNGALIEAIELDSEINSVDRMELDFDEDALWIADGEYIRRVFLDGRVNFSVYETRTIQTDKQSFTAVYSGLWYRTTTDNRTRFIKRSTQAEVPSYALDTGAETHQYGLVEYSFDSDYYSSEFPIPGDSTWSIIDWKDVNYRNFTLTEEKYHQLRLNLSKSGAYSPQVERLSVQKSLEIQRINAGSSENVYLKVEVPNSEDTSYAGDFDTYLRVRWGIPI